MQQHQQQQLSNLGVLQNATVQWKTDKNNQGSAADSGSSTNSGNTNSNTLSQTHPSKRTSTGGSVGDSNGNSMSNNVAPNLPTVPHGLASQLMLRSARGQRQYDVPQIGKFTSFLIYFTIFLSGENKNPMLFYIMLFYNCPSMCLYYFNGKTHFCCFVIKTHSKCYSLC